MLLAIIDTNVVVSGMLVGVGPSPNRRIVDAMLAGELRFVLSEALLAEYRRVLLRPAIVQRHGLPEAEVDCVLEDLVVDAIVREPPAPGEGGFAAGDGAIGARGDADIDAAGDEHVIALLVEVPGAVLVTGDLRLRRAVASRCEAVSPADFAGGLV